MPSFEPPTQSPTPSRPAADNAAPKARTKNVALRTLNVIDPEVEVRGAAPIYDELAQAFRGSSLRLQETRRASPTNDLISSAAVREGRRVRREAFDADVRSYEGLAAGASGQRANWAGAATVAAVAERDWIRATELMRSEGLLCKDSSGEDAGLDIGAIDAEASALGGALSDVSTTPPQHDSDAAAAPVVAAQLALTKASGDLVEANLALSKREQNEYGDEQQQQLDAILAIRGTVETITGLVAEAAGTSSGNTISNAALAGKKVIDGIAHLATADAVQRLEREIASARNISQALRDAEELTRISNAAKAVAAATAQLDAALKSMASEGANYTSTLTTAGREADTSSRARGGLGADQERHGASGVHLGTLTRANDSATAQMKVMDGTATTSKEFADAVNGVVLSPRQDPMLEREARSHDGSAKQASARVRVAQLSKREAATHLDELRPAMASIKNGIDPRAVSR